MKILSLPVVRASVIKIVLLASVFFFGAFLYFAHGQASNVCLNGTAGTTYSFTVTRGGTANADTHMYIRWGDGTPESNVDVGNSAPTSRTFTHSFASAGTYDMTGFSGAWSGYGDSGCVQFGCSGYTWSGGVLSGVLTGPSGSSTGAPALCKAVISAPPVPQASLNANPILVSSGNSTTLSWTSTDATSCTGVGFNTGGATSGSVSVTPSTLPTTYTVNCTGAGGSASANVTVVNASQAFACNQTISVGQNFPMQMKMGAPNPNASTAQYGISWGEGSNTSRNISYNQSAENWIYENHVYNTPGQYQIFASVPGIGYNTYPGSGAGHVAITAYFNGVYNYSADQQGGGGPARCLVTVVAPPTASLSASPTTTSYPGAASTLTWSSTNATSCTGTGFNTGGATSGSVSVSPTSTTSYSVSCTGAGGTAGASTTVTVPLPAVPTNPTVSCSTDGTKATFSWTGAPGATSYYPRVGSSPIQPQCTNFGWQVWTDGTTCFPNPDGVGGTSVVNFPVNPGQGYTFWVHSGAASGINWAQAASTNFTCTAPTPTASLSVSPTSMVNGNSSTLTWSSTNATSCTGTGFNTGGATSGSIAVNPSSTTGYSISCTGSGGTANAGATLTVTAAQCSDGIDNDGNAVTDYPADTGCTSNTDNTESGGVTPSVSCAVNPLTVPTGGSATYTATPANGASGPYTWTPSDGVSGLGTAATATRSFPTLGTYGMTVRATGAGNPSTTCPQVGVNTCSGTKTADVNATPARVNGGSTATLSWNAQNITTSCVISGPGVSQTIPAGSCTIPTTSNFTTPAINTQSVYTITCDGTLLDTVIVNVVPRVEEF